MSSRLFAAFDLLRRAAPAVLLALLVPGGGVASAADPDAATIWKNMKQALEPGRASTRTLALTIGNTEGEPRKLTVGQAVRAGAAGTRGLEVTFVMLAPPDSRGIAFLLRETPGQARDAMFSWVPMIGRTRRIYPIGSYQSFFGSEFNLGDLGFVPLQPKVKLLGKQTREGRAAYALEVVPQDTWYYSRIAVWVDPETFLPIERDFYSPANQLWKMEKIEKVETIQGQPTILRRTMADVQEKVATTIEATDVKYDVTLPDALFDPAQLRSAVTVVPWGAGGS